MNVIRYFAYYWFDMINVVMDNVRALSVSSMVANTLSQAPKSPLISTSQVRYPNAIAGLTMNRDSVIFGLDATIITGDEGVILTSGPDRHEQKLWFISRDKVYYPTLEGDWLPGGFHGAMAELIKSVEEGREPENSASSSLESSAICYAALASVREERHIVPWSEDARHG